MSLGVFISDIQYSNPKNFRIREIVIRIRSEKIGYPNTKNLNFSKGKFIKFRISDLENGYFGSNIQSDKLPRHGYFWISENGNFWSTSDPKYPKTKESNRISEQPDHGSDRMFMNSPKCIRQTGHDHAGPVYLDISMTTQFMGRAILLRVRPFSHDLTGERVLLF